MLNVHRTDANICNSKISQTNGLESCGKNAAEKKCLCVFFNTCYSQIIYFCRINMSPVLFTSYNFWQKLRYAVSRESGAIFDEDETFGRTRRGYSRRLGAVFFLTGAELD